MTEKIHQKICVILLGLSVAGGFLAAQAPPARVKTSVAPPTRVTIDVSEAMFTTMCALYAAGYEGEVSADHWGTFRTQIRERMRKQEGPAVEAVREFYRAHQFRDPASMLSRFVWFGLVSGPAPKFQPVLKREELPPEVLDLEGFSDLLSNYYAEQKMGALWKQVQPVYEREIERLHGPVSEVLFVAGAYLREVVDPEDLRVFTVIVEPLVGRITNVRSYGDHYAVVLSGSEEIPIDMVRHAYLHFLLDPLPLEYPHVVVVKRPLLEAAAKAPRLPSDLSDDFFAWFGECTVRAVEIKLKRLSPGERDMALETNDRSGYVVVRPLYLGLTEYEKNEPAFPAYYPDLVRGIDVKAEEKRVASIRFAPEEAADPAKPMAGEDVRRNRPPPVTTVPDDQMVIAQLTAGERYIAEKKPQAAEQAFQAVLAKYPDQTRAWYGMGLVALLEHNGERAKQVFGRLSSGARAATDDPLVLAWSHVYLGRIYEDEGDLERAKSEYQAVLGVKGSPVQAQRAAEKGLGDLALRKPSVRP